MHRDRGRRRGGKIFVLTFLFALISYFDQVFSSPVYYEHEWPFLDKRNIASLAREGLRRNNALIEYKRSIASLAKNGMLPTILQDDDNTTEKRNRAPLITVKQAIKKNIDDFDGLIYRNAYIYNPYEKKNIAALARDGVLKTNKKSHNQGNNNAEYYSPFFQNPMPPLSEVPWDYNGMYDYIEAYNNGATSASKIDKRHVAALLRQDNYMTKHNTPLPTPRYDDEEFEAENKRGPHSFPQHGYVNKGGNKPKRFPYAIPFPDEVEDNEVIEVNIPNYDYEYEDKRSVDTDEDIIPNFDKRHIGSLARSGWMPTFRFTGGRYSRSGRARLMMTPYSNWQYPDDPNFRAGRYISGAEAYSEASADDPFISTASVPLGKGQAYSRAANGLISKQQTNRNVAGITRNNWNIIDKMTPSGYHFRNAKLLSNNNKRYFIQPAVDIVLLRKNISSYQNLPSRIKNQE